MRDDDQEMKGDALSACQPCRDRSSCAVSTFVCLPA